VAGTAIEGEGVLLTFAALAHAGRFSLPLVIALGALGSAISNEVYFFAARRSGTEWIERRLAHVPGAHAAFHRALGLAKRHGPMLVVVGRYLVGVRSGIPLACGLVGVPPLPFAVANLAGAVLWAIPVGLLGFASARAVTTILRDLEHAESVAAIVVAVAAALVWTYRRLARRSPVRSDASP
jgi:membrane protein DedA with SNARE-associated domain